MSYKLAKRLSEAGLFPARSKAFPWWETKATHPTLEELINACGKGYFQLTHTNKGRYKGMWTAEERVLIARGKTPDEAVAKLWLNLRAK